MSSSGVPPLSPRWTAPWLAALAPLYVLSPLALLGLPYLRRLPTPARWVLLVYALSQQLPALFAPEPLLASALALGRTALMFGLMGVGIALGSADRLRPAAIGLGIVYATALLYSVFGGADVYISRLSHPYMTSISLGLAGAFGIWLSMFTHGMWWWRVPLGIGGLAVLLLSGSRGPLAAAVVGVLAGLVVRRAWRLVIPLVCGVAVLGAAVVLGERQGISAFERLSSADTTGRDSIWYNTLSVIQAYPWSGVGSYRLGSYLTPPGQPCTLFPDAQGGTGTCPEWIANLGDPWLIAHNLILQQFAETGVVGLFGFLILASFVAFRSLNSRSSLVTATVCGCLITNGFDNTLIVPSPFFAELFYIAAGLAMMSLRDGGSEKSEFFIHTGLISAIFLYLILVVSDTSTNNLQDKRIAINFADFSAGNGAILQDKVAISLQGTQGDYLMLFQACGKTCYTQAKRSFTNRGTQRQVINFSYGSRVRFKSARIIILDPKMPFIFNSVARYSFNLPE